MDKRKLIEGDINEITTAMRECRDCAMYRRIQCVYLAMVNPEMATKEIAKATLFTTRRVNGIFAVYRSEGLAGLEDGRGGRNRQNLTLEQEVEFLEPFEQESQNGTIVTVDKIKKGYEEKIGKKVFDSTIYRLLNRHGFRRIVPYRRHKKADKQQQEDFKKTSQT